MYLTMRHPTNEPLRPPDGGPSRMIGLSKFNSPRRPARRTGLRRARRRRHQMPSAGLRAEKVRRFISLRSEGVTWAAAASALGFSPATLWRWHGRYALEGVAGLSDRPRSGRPPLFDPACLSAAALRQIREMAAHAGALGAWQLFAETPDCPARLRRLLAYLERRGGPLPPALARAARPSTNGVVCG